MRRLHWAAALCLLLLLFACGAEGEAKGLRFYYRDAPGSEGHAPFGTEDGAIGFERRDIDPATFGELFELYFAAPLDPALESPFPKGLRCVSVSMGEHVLTVTLSSVFGTLSGIDRSIAEACLVRTLTQFEGVDGVRLQTEGKSEEVPVLRAQDFVLEDLSAVNNETTVRIYFSDSNGRYLVGAERRHYFADEDQIPSYIVSQLIDGPKEEGQLAVIPEGASLKDIEVDKDGLCTVDFSTEFLLNKPSTDLSERMTILAIVDSLTELPQIQEVRFLVEGAAVGTYYHMDLSRNYRRDSSAIDVVRTSLNETDATLYVRCWDAARLAPVPVSIRETFQSSLPEVLLQRLLSFQPVNDLSAPLPEETIVQGATLLDGVCSVDFSDSLLACAGDEASERRCVESVVRTLTSLDEIEQVRITVNGDDGVFQYWSLERVYREEDLS